jgi:site-specific recombinase XerD
VATRLSTVPNASPTPLELLVRDFLNSCRARGLSVKTVDQTYKPRLERQFLTWANADGISEVEQVNQRAIERYQAHLFGSGLRKEKLSTFTVNSYVRTLNVFLSWAHSEGEKVAGRGKLARTPQRLVETLTSEEIRAMERIANDRDALIVRLLADTGIRAGEICELRTDDVIEHARHDYLRVTGKGEKQRLVPVPAPLARRLRRYMRSRSAESGDTHIFLSLRRARHGEYEPLSVSGLEQMIRALAKNAGIHRRVYPHIFRHTYITELLRHGVDATKIRRVVGHSSTQLIDRVYGHLVEGDLADSVLSALRR